MGSHNVLDIADRYPELAQAMHTANTFGSHVATITFDSCIVTYSTLRCLLTRNEPQSVANILDSLCYKLGVVHLTNTVYHL